MKKLMTWLPKLIDATDDTVSMSNFVLLLLTLTALFLLVVPGIVLLIEVCYNHTIGTNLSDMGAYIASVTSLLVTGGIIKGWSGYTIKKYVKKNTTKEENNENTEN